MRRNISLDLLEFQPQQSLESRIARVHIPTLLVTHSFEPHFILEREVLAEVVLAEEDLRFHQLDFLEVPLGALCQEQLVGNVFGLLLLPAARLRLFLWHRLLPRGAALEYELVRENDPLP